MIRGGLAVLLLALPSALAGPFGGGGGGPFGSSSPPRTARQYYFVAPSSNTVGITNVGVATAEVNANRNTCVDLSGIVECRVCANITSGNVAGLKLGAQYSLNDGSTWFFMDGSTDGDMGSEGPQASLATSGWTCSSSYTAIASAAMAPVKLRAITDDGDGAADPAFATILLECR